MDYPNPGIIFALLFSLVVISTTSIGRQKANDIFSWAINQYLLYKNPIRAIDCSRPKYIPTLSYRFPDGQGDVAKFLHGESNREVWGKKYGRLYRVWNGMSSEIVLTTPEDVKAVFKDSEKHMKATNNNAGWLMGEILGKCLGLITGVDWENVRNHTKFSFSHDRVALRISRIEELTRRHFENLHAQGLLDQGLIHPVKDLRMLPFWIIADHLYGSLPLEQKTELESLITLRETLFTRVIQGGLTRFSWSQYLPTKTNRDLLNFRRRWAAFNDKCYESCKLAKEENTAAIVSMYEAMQKGSMTDEHLYQTLDEMLFANLDVTIGGISWNLVFLAAHPDIQVQLRAEIIQETGGHHKTGPKCNEYLQNTSTLLASSILESARLKPLAAFTVPQAAPTDRVVAGYLIPAGTSFVVDTHALNMRNPFWGKTSNEYQPSRFLSHKPYELRYLYWRFGFGPRQCLGKYVTDLIIRILLVHLFRDYELSLPEMGNWDREPNTWILHPNVVVRCDRLGMES